MNMNWLDELPTPFVVMAALFLGLAPFVPEPHVWEKLKMLADGTLSRPIDILDLLLHGTPFVILVLKLLRVRGG
ncbi:MAG: RND transporter [Candidatus Sedimenticola endophacoides]